MAKKGEKTKMDDDLQRVEMSVTQRETFDRYAERLVNAQREAQRAQAAFKDVCLLIGGEGCEVRQEDGRGTLGLYAPVAVDGS